MTSGEAIAELKRDIELDNDFTEEYINAVNMAIKALEQQLRQDAISRESAMLRVIEFIGNPTYTEKMFVDDLNALPPVTPQPKIGRWITSSHGFTPEPTTVCSECGFDRDFYIHPRGFNKMKVCPNCGAKMEEVTE